jgi:PAS domain S-box-containing protein
MQETGSISRITTRLAVTMSLVLALAIPAGYFLISYQYTVGTLEAEAEINGRLVSRIISANPLLWNFEELRLEELLSRRPHFNIAERRVVYDGKGAVVAKSEQPLPFPVVTRSDELLDAGTPVGRIEISRSLRPLLTRTFLATFLGIVAGLLIFRILPYRAIITAQKKLQDAYGFLNTVMESSTNAIVVLDLDGGISMANRRSQEIIGYFEETLAGRQFLDLFRGEAREQVREELAKVTAEEVESTVFETELVRRGGSIIKISCGAALFCNDGKPAGIVISADDITKRKQSEQQLRGFAAELEETNAELRSFAYIISHHLRAPLVNIKGFSAELNASIVDLYNTFRSGCCELPEDDQERITGMFEQDIPEALDFINSSVQRMDRLISSVLKLSRLGHRELKSEPVQLKEIVESIVKSMSHQLEERQATVTVGALPELTTDRIAIEQIVGNLIDNAVKYLDPSRPGRLEIFSANGPNGATIHVRDNGRGIAREDLGKIFEIFRRAGRQDVQGEGMGLAYVKTLVRKLHGQIWCNSELGVGSTFSFSIPDGREWIYPLAKPGSGAAGDATLQGGA